MLHKLIFDTTDANTIADSHHVGAHTLSGIGDLISSGDGASDNVANTFEGLDSRSFLFGYDAVGDNWDRLQLVAGAAKVYVDGGDFTVDTQIDGVYVALTNADPDNTGIIAHVRGATPGDAQQTFRSTGATPTASNIDPTTVYGLDVNSFMMAFDGTNYDRLTATNTVGALDVHVVNTISTNDSALANTAIFAAKNLLAVASTAENVTNGAALADRKYLWIYNNDNRVMYIGQSGIDSNGFPIPPGSYLPMRAGAAIDIEWVSPKASHDMRYLELS